jgi:hypothetical protein
MSTKVIILIMASILGCGLLAVWYAVSTREEARETVLVELPTTEPEVVSLVLKEVAARAAAAEAVSARGVALRPVREYAEAMRTSESARLGRLQTLSHAGELPGAGIDWWVMPTEDVAQRYIETERSSQQTLIEVLGVYRNLSHTESTANELAKLELELVALQAELTALERLLPLE